MVILLLAVGGCRKAGMWLVKSDPPVHADVLIMLMGNIEERMPYIADLYQEQRAGKVLIPEAAKGDDIMNYNLLAYTSLIDLGVPADSIVIVPGGAASTRMEAEIIRDYLVTQTGIDTLLLVTSPSHTRRAFMLFKSAFFMFNEPVVLCCTPTIYSDFHAEKWWRSRKDIKLVVMEYMKLANYFLFERRMLRGGH